MAIGISEMIAQSVQVFKSPSVETFERFERSGGVQEAVIYVVAGAAISLPLNLRVNFGVATVGFSSVIGFLVFSGLAYFIAKQQGGNGDINKVAYGISLFFVPLGLILSLIIGFLSIIILVFSAAMTPDLTNQPQSSYENIATYFYIFIILISGLGRIWFGHLVIQSSMNIREPRKIWTSVIAAEIASLLVTNLISFILT
jgi:hypothetical protein